MGVTVQVMQHDYRAVAGRQPRQRFADVEHAREITGGTGVDRLAVRRARAPALAAAVDDNPTQPGAEGGASIEYLEASHGADPCVLRDVVGGRLAAQADGETVDCGGVPPI